MMWGIHNDALGPELVEQGFVSIGWPEVGDLRAIGDDRSRMKAALERTYPTAKPGAFPVWAGVLLRFAFEMQPGDVVVAPYRRDSTINFGVIAGPYEYHADQRVHPHRRRVRWLKTGVARGLFPQETLYEIGSALTLFQIRKSTGVFQDFLSASSGDSYFSEPPAEAASIENVDSWAAEEPNAVRIEQYTRDFVRRTLLAELSHYEFEEFSADLLRAVGYQARVTQRSGDGGLDVIAHRDPLGLEPPIIKVQCKHTVNTQGRPEVQQLIGTLSSGELALFVTLGPYSREARDLERERHNLRLFDGDDVISLILEKYAILPARWRAKLPLREVYVVDREPTA